MKSTLVWGLNSWGLSGIFLFLGASYSRIVHPGEERVDLPFSEAAGTVTDRGGIPG